MLLISHRGYHKQHAENSLEAFQAAVDMGADGIETDLRLTKDGRLILFHDRHVGELNVADLDYSEIASAVGRRVALAEDALERFDGILWNLEIKSRSAVDPAVRLIQRFLGRRRLLVSSFWHDAVEQIAGRVDVECGVLVSHRPFDSFDFSRLMPRGIGTIVWYYEFVDDATLGRAQSTGIKNWTYAVQTRYEHRDAAARGFDGLITDHLEYLGRGVS